MLEIEIKKKQALSQIEQFCDLDQQKIENLEEFIILLLKENNNFNLIGNSTIPDIWNRHIVDSAQIMKFIDSDKKIADFGTGAGFPGIILSILGVKKIHLIEKSIRKCEFLRKAKILSSNPIFIHQAKLEELENEKFDIITSRALASLDKLLSYSQKFLSETGFAIFLKGKNLKNELIEAQKKFDFNYELFDSLTSQESKIIKISNIKKQ